jgi:nicotinate-nucleotide adenylyltransferase
VKLAILGGSFNPVHLGHLWLADAALTTLGYDRIILIPAFTSPFKPGASGSSPQDRLDMLAASVAVESALALDDCEIRREGVSYTIDTIDEIIRRYRPEGKPGLILGDDLAVNFSHWRNAREIAEKADLVIARRTSEQRIDFSFPCTWLDNAIMEVSSGAIRRNIREGGAWRFLVPEGARFIVEDRGLYRDPVRPDPPNIPPPPQIPPEISALLHLSAAPRGEPGPHSVHSAYSAYPAAKSRDGIRALTARVEAAARTMLNSARFLHSRGTALLAVDLARRYGLDENAAYLAGIAHDICKSFSAEDMLAFAEKDGEEITKLERKKTSLLHARAGAVLLKEKFNIEDETILEAVRFHTTGKENMGSLAKIVFVADKIEVSRPDVKPSLRNTVWVFTKNREQDSLDRLFSLVLDETVMYLHSRDVVISEGTLRLLDSMHKRKR